MIGYLKDIFGTYKSYLSGLRQCLEIGTTPKGVYGKTEQYNLGILSLIKRVLFKRTV